MIGDREWASPYEMKGEEQLREKAAGRGCTLLVADGSTLLCDLDTEAARDQFLRMVDQIRDTMSSRVCICEHQLLPSRNGRWHGVVKLAESHELPEILALQAMLGSDPLREFLMLAEYMLCGATVNCLFRPESQLSLSMP